MNRKISILLIIQLLCFTTGLFLAITLSPVDYTLSVNDFSGINFMLRYIKEDMLTVAVTMLLSATFFLYPFAFAFLLFKTFSLGFTAVCLLNLTSEKGLLFLSLVLLPRALFKIPAYLILITVSFNLSGMIYAYFRNHGHINRHYIYQSFGICTALLLGSSIIEVLLLKSVL